jgi:hypothetical protein
MDHGSARSLFRVAAACLLAVACASPSPARNEPTVDRIPLGEEPGRPFDAPLARAPLAPPLDVTGGFCEFRVGHFHAGFDFGTGHRVGKPVLAPGPGHVARVRASGIGYGRSIYLATDDGRLLQFGHLDAFAEPLASFVRQAQDSSGQYEQDLWPEAKRFRYQPGDVIAWTGESGAGGPHLHFEVRRGDMAYHPFRAGLAPRDSSPPTLASLTLEPLDEASQVEGGLAPFTLRLSARSETLRVRGRLRAVVGARDGVWQGVDRMVPWSVGLEWQGRRVECRFDSVSWADDMAESDYVYDTGRVVGDKGMVLWAPAGFRPRVIHSDAALGEEAGTIEVRGGDPPRGLRLWARDLGGNRTEHVVTLVPAAGGPDTTDQPSKPTRRRRSELEIAALPGARLRVTAGIPEGSRMVRIVAGGESQTHPVTTGPRGATAIVSLTPAPGSRPEWTVVGSQGRTGKSEGWLQANSYRMVAVSRSEPATIEAHSYRVRVPAGAAFEPAVLLARGDEATLPSGELHGGGPSLVLEPASLPLRRPVQVGYVCPPSAVPRDVALYRRGEDGWDWIGGSFDQKRGEFSADSRQLGRFALMRDTLAPRVLLRRPRRIAETEPYSRWALEASVTENGSGVDGRASYFVVDGKRVPTEWDSEQRRLRWRPARRPPKGQHRVEVIAADRAANTRRSLGTFVLD